GVLRHDSIEATQCRGQAGLVGDGCGGNEHGVLPCFNNLACCIVEGFQHAAGCVHPVTFTAHVITEKDRGIAVSINAAADIAGGVVNVSCGQGQTIGVADFSNPAAGGIITVC